VREEGRTANAQRADDGQGVTHDLVCHKKLGNPISHAANRETNSEGREEEVSARETQRY
jgi:hypothetical protein